MDEQENTKAITDEVKDISGELQRKREEALQKKIEQRKTALIEFYSCLCQTPLSLLWATHVNLVDF